MTRKQIEKKAKEWCKQYIECDGNCRWCPNERYKDYFIEGAEWVLSQLKEGGEDGYVGQSEDLYDYLHGRDSEIDREEQRRQEEAYYQEMYNRHEQEMQQMFDALAEEGGEK